MLKRIKYGRLYWLQLEAADIDKFLLVRIFRKLGITYIPWSLRWYDELFLREDRTQYSRLLINYCRKHGVVTYVVQEGPVYHSHQARWTHLPLYADVFLCPSADREMWIAEGMPREKIRIYDMQKRKEDYQGVLFLEPFVTWNEFASLRINERNARILQVVFEMLDQDVLFAVSKHYADLVKPFLPPHRIVEGSAEDLIKSYKKIFCFSKSDVVGLCQKMSKPCTVVDDKNPLPTMDDLKGGKMSNDSQADDRRGIALLGAFTKWDSLGVTWRKDFHNVRVFKSLAELDGKNVFIKPHYSEAEWITPFLPPDRIIWENAESLIKRHDEIYCFWDSSVRKDCEILGKQPILIGVPQ